MVADVAVSITHVAAGIDRKRAVGGVADDEIAARANPAMGRNRRRHIAEAKIADDGSAADDLKGLGDYQQSGAGRDVRIALHVERGNRFCITIQVQKTVDLRNVNRDARRVGYLFVRA